MPDSYDHWQSRDFRSNQAFFGSLFCITSSKSSGFDIGSTSLGGALDGDKVSPGSLNAWAFNSSFAVAGEWLEWDFYAPIIMTGFKQYQNDTTTHGTWKMQGWDGASWVDVSGNFTWGDVTNTWERTWTNTTAYSKYRLLGVSGSTVASAGAQMETEFKIDHLTPASQNDRTGSITVSITGLTLDAGSASNLVNGSYTFGQGITFTNGQAVAGNHVDFDLGTAYTVHGICYRCLGQFFGPTWRWQYWDGAAWQDARAAGWVPAKNLEYVAFDSPVDTDKIRMLGVSGNTSNDEQWEVYFAVEPSGGGGPGPGGGSGDEIQVFVIL